jgi:hypothetical protein
VKASIARDNKKFGIKPTKMPAAEAFFGGLWLVAFTGFVGCVAIIGIAALVWACGILF